MVYVANTVYRRGFPVFILRSKLSFVFDDYIINKNWGIPPDELRSLHIPITFLRRPHFDRLQSGLGWSCWDLSDLLNCRRFLSYHAVKISAHFSTISKRCGFQISAIRGQSTPDTNYAFTKIMRVWSKLAHFFFDLVKSSNFYAPSKPSFEWSATAHGEARESSLKVVT